MKTRRLDQVAKSIRVLIQQGEKSINKCSSYSNQEKIIFNDFFYDLGYETTNYYPGENISFECTRSAMDHCEARLVINLIII